MPLRIEIGMKEVSQNNAVLVRRDNREKIVATLDSIATTAEKTLQEIQKSLYQKALKFQKDNTTILENYKEMQDYFTKQGGAVEAYWDGTKETADKIQEQTKATIRLILEDDIQNKKCIFSGKPAVFKVLFGIAY